MRQRIASGCARSFCSYLKVSFELLHFVRVLGNLIVKPNLAWTRNGIQTLIHGIDNIAFRKFKDVYSDCAKRHTNARAIEREARRDKSSSRCAGIDGTCTHHFSRTQSKLAATMKENIQAKFLRRRLDSLQFACGSKDYEVSRASSNRCRTLNASLHAIEW